MLRSFALILMLIPKLALAGFWDVLFGNLQNNPTPLERKTMCEHALTLAAVDWDEINVDGDILIRIKPSTYAKAHYYNRRALDLQTQPEFRYRGIQGGPIFTIDPEIRGMGSYNGTNGLIRVLGPSNRHELDLWVGTLEHEIEHARLYAAYVNSVGSPPVTYAQFSGNLLSRFGGELGARLARTYTSWTPSEILSYAKSAEIARYANHVHEAQGDALAQKVFQSVTTAVAKELLTVIQGIGPGPITSKLGLSKSLSGIVRFNDGSSPLRAELSLSTFSDLTPLNVALSAKLTRDDGRFYTAVIPLVMDDDELPALELYGRILSQLQALERLGKYATEM